MNIESEIETYKEQVGQSRAPIHHFFAQGILNEGEESVQLTSLNHLFLSYKIYLLFTT
jgi:hypothetical protein